MYEYENYRDLLNQTSRTHNRSNREGRVGTKEMRSGTVNEGYEYEKIAPAYLALKLLQDKTVKSFNFELNSRSYQKFDDLVITVVKSDNTVENFAIQLKHREEEHRTLDANKEFNKINGAYKNNANQRKAPKTKGFNISQFINAYRSQEENIQETHKFILFTNVIFEGINNVTNYEILKKDTPFKVALFNNGDIYQFKEHNNAYFCKNFYLLSRQMSVEEMNKAIIDIFVNDFHSNEEAAICYIDFFQRLRNFNYVNTKITRDTVLVNITKLLLSKYFISFHFSSKRNAIMEMIEDAIKMFDLTLVPNVSSKFLKENWKPSRSAEEPIDLLRDLKLLQKKEKLPEKASPLVKSLLTHTPLFIQVSKSNESVVHSVVSLIQTLENYKINLVLVGQITTDFPPEIRTFKCLQDLEFDSPLYESITNFKITLQGREPTLIKNLKFLKIDKLITPSEIFGFLEKDTLVVGTKFEPLPDFFIPRSLLRSEVSLDQLKNLCAGGPTIVNCGGFSKAFRRSLQEQGFDYDIFEHNLILTDTDTKPPDLRLKDGCLEWVQKKIDTQSIFDNSLNILSGDSGVGKSTMMKHLAQTCPSDFWVVRVLLQQVGTLFRKDNNIDDVLRQLLAPTKQSEFDERVCEDFLNSGRILFLFDGLNELNCNAISEALVVIRGIAQKKHKIWISGHRNLPEVISGSFKIFFSYTVEDITLGDQRNYVYKRLDNAGFHKDTIDKILWKLYEEKNKQEVILKLPLILYILTENIIRNENFDLEKATLHQMYATFVEGQFQHNLEKTGITELCTTDVIIEGFKNYQFGGYQIAALQTCLEPDLFENLKIRMDCSFVRSIRTFGDFLGLVKVNKDNTFTFSHRSFGEFFAAMWFGANFRELGAFIFKPEYGQIRWFFDAKLAEGCPLHLAVLEGNVDEVRKLVEKVGDRDGGGRTPVHLAASLGKLANLKVPQNYKENTKREEILKILLNHGGDPSIKDELFGWNVFEYAAASLRLSSLEEMSKYHVLKWEYLKNVPLKTLSYFCVTTPYLHLLELAINTLTLPELDKLHSKTSLLNEALGSNQKSIAVLLIEKGADLNKLDIQKQTPLHKAATWGHTDIVKLLVAKGVDIEAQDAVGRTALQLASKMGHKDVVAFLVEKGAKLEARDQDSKTAIQRAACNGRTEIVKYLVEKGADINASNLDRKNALHRAAEMGHCETIKVLVKNGADRDSTDKYKMTALHFAARGGHQDVVEYLLEEDFDVFARDEEERSPKDLAESRRFEKITAILADAENQKIPRSNNQNAIFDAAKTGDLETIKQLVSTGANIEEVNHYNETVLHVAAAKGHHHIVMYLLSDNANTAATNNLGRVPLHHACYGGNFFIVKELLNRGQDAATDDLGLYPIHRAAFKGHLEVVKLLVENGADVNARSSQGLTSLHSASLGGRNEVIKYLVSVGADIEAKNCKHESVLHIAVLEGWPETVEFLVQNYKIIDEVDASGLTALYLAASKGNKKMVQSLLQGGADVHIMDNLRRTAMEAARNADHMDIVKILQNY